VQYAENPPKKYQDTYPLEFETENWRELWEELKSVVLFWIEQGVCIFRVDNPHTKPFAFWEWLISEVKADYPEVIFLSEAFTRPKIMYQLAKLGFTQSYTYFTWRNVKWELTQYFTELTQTDVREFFCPNLWPNTPDILNDYLRDGGRPAFMTRLVLAATLGANYGIYGPAFELCENRRKDKESEEYLNSEKYELKQWDIESPNSLKDFIARVNGIRRENLALQSDLSLRFHSVDNDQLICYSKRTEDLSNVILVVVNLDYQYIQSGWVDLSLEELGLDRGKSYKVHDLLADATYRWQGPRNYVELDPQNCGTRMESSMSFMSGPSMIVMVMASATSLDSPRSWIILRIWESPQSGSYPSILLHSKTTATMSRTTPVSTPRTGRFATSGSSSARPIIEAFA